MAVMLIVSCAGHTAFAQEMREFSTGKPMFTVLPAKPAKDAIQPASALTTWTGSYVYNGSTYTYNMVGLAPSSNSTVTINAVIVPLKIVITRRGSTSTFDAAKVLPNGNSVTTNTVNSPIFDHTTTYVQGGVNVGTTQYLDAYQRANFWGTVSSHPSYHVLLNPIVMPEQTLTPPSSQATTGSPFGTKVGEVNINWMDTQLNALITKLGITANEFPIFLSDNVYLTQNGCCIGGYHSATGAQSYTYSTYVDQSGEFAQDVSALSHEIGEWVDDPLVANPNGSQTPCGILENGDPLENNANYGAYVYSLHGFNYNLQDLVTLPYFGAPASTSVNGFTTFQGQRLSVCQNGS